MSAALASWRKRPLEFIESILFDPETGQPFKLLPAERAFLEHAFKIGPNGRLLYTEWLYSCPKKSGKTTFEAIIELTMLLLFGGAYPEAYVLANSQEQGKGRCFEMCCRIVNASPLLKNEAVITADRITFPAFNAAIHVVPCDAGSAAGTNAVCAGFDELWAYTAEAARRLWDEMTPPPTRKIACRVTVTYAGFEGESVLLEELYRRGLQQPQIGEDLYGGDGLLMFWTHKPVAPWQDEAWIAGMRRERASAYQRQVLNEFASSSSQFIEMDAWRRCVDPNATPVFSDKNLSVFVGLDAAPKRDSTAIVAMAWDGRGDKLRLINHVVFQPTPQQPLDFEATIERTLLEWRRRYALRGVWFDPYQMAAVAQRLQKAGIRMVEFAQTQSNLIAIGSNLFELIKSSNLIVYPAAELQLAISHAVAKETSRGFMITKEKQAHKIDVVVALAMASYAAVQRSRVQPVKIVSPLIFSNGQWWSDGQANTPAPAGYRPTNEPWRSYVAGPDIGLRTFGPPPGSGPRDW